MTSWNGKNDVARFQLDINLVGQELANCLLTLQPAKCRSMLFTYSNTAPRFDTNLYIDQSPLERVSQYKYLRISMNSKLTFSSHSRTVTVQATRKFRSSAPTYNYVLQRVYLICILPSLLYGIETWYPSANI